MNAEALDRGTTAGAKMNGHRSNMMRQFFQRLFGRASTPARPMVSLVALLRAPYAPAIAVLQDVLAREYPGHFTGAEDDASFAYADPELPGQTLLQSSVAEHGGLFLLLASPAPYTAVSDIARHATTAEGTALLRAHTAWLSIDLIEDREGDTAAYRFIGRSLAALLPPDTVALVRPATSALIPFTPDARAALRQPSVLSALGV